MDDERGEKSLGFGKGGRIIITVEGGNKKCIDLSIWGEN